jgi:hypothetical protein
MEAHRGGAAVRCGRCPHGSVGNTGNAHAARTWRGGGEGRANCSRCGAEACWLAAMPVSCRLMDFAQHPPQVVDVPSRPPLMKSVQAADTLPALGRAACAAPACMQQRAPHLSHCRPC